MIRVSSPIDNLLFHFRAYGLLYLATLVLLVVPLVLFIWLYHQHNDMSSLSATFHRLDNGWTCEARNEYGYTATAVGDTPEAAFSNVLDLLD